MMTTDQLYAARAILSERHEELASESRSMNSPNVTRRSRSGEQERARHRRLRSLYRRMEALQTAMGDLLTAIREREEE